MNLNLSKIILALALLSPLAYAARPELVSQSQDGIVITARAMSAGECLDTFYQDLHTKHVYPIILSITNNSSKATVFSNNFTEVLNAKVLTPKSIDSQISALNIGTFFFVITIALIPLAFATSNLAGQLQALKPLIERFSSGDQPITIEPGSTFKTVIFADVEYPKDADGKTQSFVVPDFLETSIELRSNSWFDFMKTNSNTFNLEIPTK